MTHQSPTAQTVMVAPELIENTQDKAKVAEVVRTITGRPNAQVVNVRKVVGPDGRMRAYEVDIR